MNQSTSRSVPFDPVKRLDEILNGCRDQGGTITRANEEHAVRQLAQELLAAASESRSTVAPSRPDWMANAVVMGDIDCGDFKTPFGLLLTFPCPEAIREALKMQRIAFKVMGEEPK